MTIIPVLTFLPPDRGSWTAGPVPLHLVPGSVAGARTPKELRACHGIGRLVGAGQPAGVLPSWCSALLTNSISDRTGQDLVGVHPALVWVPASAASILTGVSFHLPEGGLKAVLGRRLAEI